MAPSPPTNGGVQGAGQRGSDAACQRDLLRSRIRFAAAKRRAPNAGLLLAYEETGYDNTSLVACPISPHVSAARIKADGANAVKVLIYYTPFEKPEIDNVKHAFIERIGDEYLGRRDSLLEFVGYDPEEEIEKRIEYARRKPDIVVGSMREFAKEQYHVDVLKFEVPVTVKFVEGGQAFGGEAAYTKSQALEHFRTAAAAIVQALHLPERRRQ